jgi:hypothetical protein
MDESCVTDHIFILLHSRCDIAQIQSIFQNHRDVHEGEAWLALQSTDCRHYQYQAIASRFLPLFWYGDLFYLPVILWTITDLYDFIRLPYGDSYTIGRGLQRYLCYCLRFPLNASILLRSIIVCFWVGCLSHLPSVCLRHLWLMISYLQYRQSWESALVSLHNHSPNRTRLDIRLASYRMAYGRLLCRTSHSLIGPSYKSCIAPEVLLCVDVNYMCSSA